MGLSCLFFPSKLSPGENNDENLDPWNMKGSPEYLLKHLLRRSKFKSESKSSFVAIHIGLALKVQILADSDIAFHEASHS